MSVDLLVWPTYDLLHVLHYNLYMLLEFTLFSGIMSHNWLYRLLHVLSAMFKLVFLSKLVTLCTNVL